MKTLVCSAVTLALLISGCSNRKHYAYCLYCLNPEYRVGGGFQIEYEAPTAGMAYLVEDVSGRMISSESLEEGAWFSLDMDPSDDLTLKRLNAMGIDPKIAQLSLYFVPIPSKAEN